MSPSRKIVTVSKAMRERLMQSAMTGLVRHFGPRVGIALFTFDFGERAFLSYKSNASRDDVLVLLDEFLRINRGEPSALTPTTDDAPPPPAPEHVQ
jgi:hypothetical protein